MKTLEEAGWKMFLTVYVVFIWEIKFFPKANVKNKQNF